MSDPNEPLRRRLSELVVPSDTEIRRGKRAILESLDDEKAHRSGFLMRKAIEAIGVAVLGPDPRVRFLDYPTPEAVDSDDHTLASMRAHLASQEAMAELAGEGLIVSTNDPGNQEPISGPIEVVRVRIDHSGGSFGLTLDAWPPQIGGAYRLGRYRPSPPWFLDPDLFLEDLSTLGLDERATRALRESLRAYRAGLYLACGSLLGVVSETVWYGVAIRIGKPPKLVEAVERERTADVLKLVTDQFREARVRPATLPDELHSHATLLREIRNYGVHQGPVKEELERFFNPDTCGVLLLNTHNYLVRLGRAAEQLTGASAA